MYAFGLVELISLLGARELKAVDDNWSRVEVRQRMILTAIEDGSHDSGI